VSFNCASLTNKEPRRQRCAAQSISMKPIGSN
jgi:hypothetical protein